MPHSITVSDLTWSVPSGQPLFSSLTLNFSATRTGLIGQNGVGKSTLLRLLAGEIRPLSGQVFVSGKLGLMSQSMQSSGDATIADLFGATAALHTLQRAEQGIATESELADADWTLESRIASALDRVRITAPPHTSLDKLSGGQLTRVRLAALLFAAPDFLLLDEPTNNLDRNGRETVIEVLSHWKTGAIVVSHDRELLETMDSIVELTTLGATRYGGNWSHYREQKTVELSAIQRELADAEQRLAEVDLRAQTQAERHARSNSRGRKQSAKGGQPRIILGGMKDRSEKTGGSHAQLAERRREDALDAAARARDKIEVLQPLSVELSPTGLPTHKIIVKLDAVTVGYLPEQPVFQNLSLTVSGPERIAILGPNGSGKSTLLALITKQLAPWKGSVTVSARSALLDQMMKLLDPSISIRENFLRMHPGSDEQTCRAALARFRFRAEAALQSVATLSGGQLLRAGLACVLGGHTPPPLLILDEPTNHLDLESIASIEAGLHAYDGALLIVSHDEPFLQHIGVTRRIVLNSLHPLTDNL